jgi:hypothetical protein
MAEECTPMATETTGATEDAVNLLLAVAVGVGTATPCQLDSTPVDNNMQAKHRPVAAVSEKWKCRKCGCYVVGWKKRCSSPCFAWKGGKREASANFKGRPQKKKQTEKGSTIHTTIRAVNPTPPPSLPSVAAPPAALPTDPQPSSTVESMAAPPPVVQRAPAAITIVPERLEFASPNSDERLSSVTSPMTMDTLASASTTTTSSDGIGHSLESQADILNAATTDAFMECEESGDWGSDNEGDEILDFIAASTEADEGRGTEDLAVHDDEVNFIGGVKAEGWTIPEAPDGWAPYARRVEKDEPTFESLDNPGGWSPFIFRPTFKMKDDKKYIRHSLPTGVRPVPADENGDRIVGDWMFHYQGWKSIHFPNLGPVLLMHQTC